MTVRYLFALILLLCLCFAIISAPDPPPYVLDQAGDVIEGPTVIEAFLSNWMVHFIAFNMIISAAVHLFVTVMGLAREKKWFFAAFMPTGVSLIVIWCTYETEDINRFNCLEAFVVMTMVYLSLFFAIDLSAKIMKLTQEDLQR